MQSKNILIEGWRGINHSYAMVNQFQLLELVRQPGLVVLHRDLPFANPRWTPQANGSQFPAAMQTALDHVPPPDGRALDVVLRIASPFERSPTPATKVLTFMTAEGGLGPENFPPNTAPIASLFTGNASIVCPSRWAHMKLQEYGIPGERMAIVPHGIHPDIFYPLTAAQRSAVRERLGLQPQQHVFLNLGAMSVNKGIDLLLRAFFEVHLRHPSARLVLKDEKNLYGLSGVAVVQDAMQRYPQLSDQGFLDTIKLLSVTLPMEGMRELYCLADSYVSPYRAEGFNLPVIEAIACGTPVIVTAGGATDDFCDARTSLPVSAHRRTNAAVGWSGSGYHLEPELDALIAAMEADIHAPRAATATFLQGQAQLRADFSWAACVERLVQLF
jgi:glycosyltransferase involved in cell wall biosynthesis